MCNETLASNKTLPPFNYFNNSELSPQVIALSNWQKNRLKKATFTFTNVHNLLSNVTSGQGFPHHPRRSLPFRCQVRLAWTQFYRALFPHRCPFAGCCGGSVQHRHWISCCWFFSLLSSPSIARGHEYSRPRRFSKKMSLNFFILKQSTGSLKISNTARLYCIAV